MLMISNEQPQSVPKKYTEDRSPRSVIFAASLLVLRLLKQTKRMKILVTFFGAPSSVLRMH
jgi:hypothetical protein